MSSPNPSLLLVVLGVVYPPHNWIEASVPLLFVAQGWEVEYYIPEGMGAAECECIVSGALQIQGQSSILRPSSHFLALAVLQLKGEIPKCY